MTTVRDIVEGAMRLNGTLFKSESPAADEAADGLERLNEMIASMSNESLLVYALSWESFTLTANDGEYTIGTGANFNTDRPLKIVSAFIRENNNDYPLQIVPDDDYNLKIYDKTTATNIPIWLNYDNGFPTGKIRLWPVPTVANALHMQMEKQFTQFAGLNTDITLPPGWLKMLRYNLAVELAPEYGLEINPLVLKGAEESKALLKSKVLQQREMTYQGPRFTGVETILNQGY